MFARIFLCLGKFHTATVPPPERGTSFKGKAAANLSALYGGVEFFQEAEHAALRIQPVARLGAVRLRLFDGRRREVCRKAYGGIRIRAARKCADERARIHVARTVEGALHLFSRVFFHLARLVGVVHGAERAACARFVAAGHGGAGAERTELCKQCGVVKVFRIRRIRQCARLGQVGHDDVCLAAKSLHLFHERLVEVHVQFAVVAHDGVDDHQPVLFEEFAPDRLDHLDLTDAAEIPADDDVVFKPEALPVRNDRRNVLREVAEGVARKAARVGGEDGGGQNVAGDAARRNDGQGDGQGAFSHAGDVVDRKYAHGAPPIKGFRFIIVCGDVKVK